MKISNTDGLSDTAVNRVAAGAHEAVDKMAGATNDAAAAIGEKGQQIKRSQEKWIHDVQDYVAANPATAIGIAVAGGYLLSRLLSAR